VYFVDREQIEQRLTYIRTFLIQASDTVERDVEHLDPLVLRLSRERVLHLSIEAVTDIGSLMIDGFVMRDASSYEDIIEVLQGEEVFDLSTGAELFELVKLRRLLVQRYDEVDERLLAAWGPKMSQLLSVFADSIEQYLERELG
jgi:uncharacterized protein YutE (UPF0331/DUF86 family)